MVPSNALRYQEPPDGNGFQRGQWATLMKHFLKLFIFNYFALGDLANLYCSNEVKWSTKSVIWTSSNIGNMSQHLYCLHPDRSMHQTYQYTPLCHSLDVHYARCCCFFYDRTSISIFISTFTLTRHWWMDSCTATSTRMSDAMNDRPFSRSCSARMPKTFHWRTHHSTAMLSRLVQADGKSVND